MPSMPCAQGKVYTVWSGKKAGKKAAVTQTDDSFTEPHGEIASSLRSSQ
jgi:hypothetical protein